MTLLVGVVCGLTAVAFHLTIRAVESRLIERALHAEGDSWMFWTIISPTLGGLCAGACLTWLVPGARGSGIPQVKLAYATEGGRVRFRDALGKFVIGALQIGSGASLGREGPTVQICAGATSLLARVTALPQRHMRRLMPVGVAAGIAAAFNAPIAAVTFTIEEIVGALDNTVLSGVVVAAALAAVIERGVLGVHPVLEIDRAYELGHASSLVTYAVLGVAAGGLSVFFTDALLKLRLWFRRLHVVPRWAQPAVGGLVTGMLAVLVLTTLQLTGVTGGGYETLGRALAGSLGLKALFVLCGVKLVATVFSYSSGGAGGIFAPSLFIGAMLGGLFGYCDVWLFDHEPSQLGAFALVGMGAVFAGVIRAPITSVLIIFELTGGYGLVLPLMLANMTSYMLARSWREQPVYEALLAQDGLAVPNAYARAPGFDQLTVGSAMTTPAQYVMVGQCLAEAATQLRDHAFALAPLVNEQRQVLGALSVDGLQRAAVLAPDADSASLLVNVSAVHEREPLMQALVRMTELGARQLCVLDERDTLVGMLALSDIVRIHTRDQSLTSALQSRRALPPAEAYQSH
ncbi:MAG: chloride channel protein [Polyangiales bacterium]